MAKFEAIFSQELVKQFQKLSTNAHLRSALTRLLDKLEQEGPRAGELLDARLHLYELKNKHPPLRIYYRPRSGTMKIDVFAYEMKTSSDRQRKTIDNLRRQLQP